jgi:anaerobic selenocysteine-containing dehydrogenase
MPSSAKGVSRMDQNDKAQQDPATAPEYQRGPSRRQFLGGLTTGAVAIGAVAQAGCGPAVPPLKTLGAVPTTTVCPFCGVGCGQVVSTRDGQVINIEGDPGHPISEGTLCSKGAAAIQVVNNPRRLQKVLYRKPGGTAWEALACLGGSALDNEEAYVLAKLMKALGLAYVEHQARL